MPTALIVEDQVEANTLLGMLVQLRGYRTDSAYDGAEALAKARGRAPDVVFLDLMLPDVDGYDVCRSLKASGTTSQVPVIIVTARIGGENRIKSFRAGADDYIIKPYTPEQVYEALELSDSWKEQMAAPQVDGRVVLDGRDDGETLRRLAQLRSLILARRVLPVDAVEGVCSAIEAIWSSVHQWGHGCRLEQVASLAYVLTLQSLTLTVHDEGEWLSGPGRGVGEQIASMPDGARFDEVIADQTGKCLRLFKRFDRLSGAMGE
jgi:CheY-like chemotaxis protein